MKHASLVDVRNNLASLIRFVQRGGEVFIQKRNIVVAKIIPVPGVVKNKTKLGCGLGTVKTKGDLTEPFMPASDWEMLA